MVKDFCINRQEGDITIYTATTLDKEKYFYILTEGEYASLLKEGYEKGIEFWKNMFLPVIVAMSMSQNVVAALSEGWPALAAGLSVVIVA